MIFTALAASAAALAAAATAWLAFFELRQQGEKARAATGVQSMWRFIDEWGAPDMVATRSAAAASLLAQQPAPDVAEVLGFFDEIAFLVERGVLDEELVGYEFYWPMANYWAASEAYVLRARGEDAATWKHLDRLVSRLAEIERQRRGRGSAIPTPAEVRGFLEVEAAGPECTEEDGTEVRRLPFRAPSAAMF